LESARPAVTPTPSISTTVSALRAPFQHCHQPHHRHFTSPQRRLLQGARLRRRPSPNPQHQR
ncbi:hypothetical protein ILUMI_19033, partial [Ignelater luminosus]